MNTRRPSKLTSVRNDWGPANTAGVSIASELAFNRVGFSVGSSAILRDISMVAPSGSVTCLLGPSGSGKTTLLRIAAGMERASSGSLTRDGIALCGPGVFVPPEKRGIGLVFQDYALFPHLSVLENVKFGLAKLSSAEALNQSLNILKRVGLADRKDNYPHQLSGGEQQRIALARALAPRPGILLMDEPFSGLDSRLRDTMREETLAVLKETRATSVIVTHDPEEALRMGDQIVLLRDGEVEQIGTGHALYFRPKSLFVAGFFSELVEFDGFVDLGRVMTPLGPVPINGARDGDPAIAAFRVGSIRVEAEPTDTAQASGRVLSSRFIGEHELLRIGIRGAEDPIRVRVPAGSIPGDSLSGLRDVFLTPQLGGSFAFPAL